MDKSKTDLVMQFVLNGKPILAECVLDIWNKDKLMEGFKSASYERYSNFFEINDFDFNIALKEDDEGSSTFTQQSNLSTGTSKFTQKPATAGAFASWRSATNDELRKIYYPLEFDKFSFKRNIDRASTTFFESCCTSQTFDRAVLVKRRSQGGTLPAAGYLRMDFTEVLITGIEWDDGDMIEEKCEFICRGMAITYRKQKDDGTIDTSAGATDAKWDTARARKTAAQRRG